MAGINSLGMMSKLNTYSSLFGTSVSNNTSTDDTSASLLSNWASIKNGSYGKLTKAYYNKNPEKAVAQFKDEANALLKKNNGTNTDASKLVADVKAISDNKKLFNEVKSTDAEGTVTTDYDRKAIGDAVKNFVKDYNAVLDSGVQSDNSTVLRNTLHMTNTTNVNSNLLSDVGINVGLDNKLSIDDEKLASADVSKLKTLFSGNASYASMVGANASNIMNAISYENNKLSNYTAGGSYEMLGMVGSLYDGTY